MATTVVNEARASSPMARTATSRLFSPSTPTPRRATSKAYMGSTTADGRPDVFATVATTCRTGHSTACRQAWSADENAVALVMVFHADGGYGTSAGHGRL